MHGQISHVILIASPCSHVAGQATPPWQGSTGRVKFENNAEYTNVTFNEHSHDIKPNTNYTLRLQASYKERYSADTRTIYIKTKQSENIVSTWMVGSIIIGVTLTMVIVVVLVIRRSCFYRVVTDDTLKNNKILEKARTTKPLLPYCQENSEIIDEISRYIPIQVKAEESPEVPALCNTCPQDQPSTLDGGPVPASTLPMSLDIAELIHQSSPMDTSGDNQHWAFPHLYSNHGNVVRSRKISETDTLASEPRSPISPYCNMSGNADGNDKKSVSPDVAKIDHTTKSLNHGKEQNEHDENQSENAANGELSTCQFQHESYINMAKDQNKECLNNNTLILPTPSSALNYFMTTDDYEQDITESENENNTLDSLDTAESTCNNPVLESNVTCNVENYIIADKLGFFSACDLKGKQQECPDVGDSYVQHQSLGDMQFAISDKDDNDNHYDHDNNEGQGDDSSYCPHAFLKTVSKDFRPHDLYPEMPSTDYLPRDHFKLSQNVSTGYVSHKFRPDLLSAGYCPHDTFQVVMSDLKSSLEEDACAGAMIDPTDACLQDSHGKVARKEVTPNMEYTKFSELPLLMPSIAESM
ncbi:uncharacterized protein [Amphiura filiformis]|uniref:uncharacterized protein n=1 Tax=Amphiura filiformis TaxID=82378 RepID=UPI003B20D38B